MSDNDTKKNLRKLLQLDDDNPVNWAAQDTKIKHHGREIVLPADPDNMNYDDAIATLERVKEQESQKFDVKEIVTGAPWDALVAIYKAMQQIYGVVTSHSIQTWFGDIKPEFITIHTGPGDHERLQVPKGLMRVPGVSEPFYLDFYGTGGAAVYGTLNKRDSTRLVEIANLARKIIRTESVYKDKAIRLPVNEQGQLDLGRQPEFLDLASVQESDMIHTRKTESSIRTNIFSPLKNTANCRKHKIPLKRGILLEGRYGTGKSLTARVTAKVAIDNGWTFLMLDRSQGLKAAIEFGRAYQPCVIFAEDIDRAADRANESVNDLVNLIDGVITKNMEMMVVLTTNFIEKVDQALLRPGRFDAIISIQVPDAETSIRLIKAYARDLLSPDVDLTKIGQTIAGEIPATIREVVERSKLNMLAEDRDYLNSEDLEVSALSMRRQIDLLKPKGEEKTGKDFLWDGFAALMAENGAAGGGVSLAQLANASGNTDTLVRNVYEALKKQITGVDNKAAGAASKADEGVMEIKKLTGMVSSRPVAAPKARA